MTTSVESESAPPPGRLVGRLGARLRASAEMFLGDPVHRQKIKFFRSIILFKDLGRWDLARLVNRTMEKTYAPGDVVFQEGHLGRAFSLWPKAVWRSCVGIPRQIFRKPWPSLGPAIFLVKWFCWTNSPALPRAARLRPPASTSCTKTISIFCGPNLPERPRSSSTRWRAY
jgi:hypothetical protein